MTSQLLLRHFARISDAPDAIPRLRRFILDLAVRGKLVEQDPNDEPASEQMKRIQLEKSKLVDEGRIRKEKLPHSVGKTSYPFAVPRSWLWAKIADATLFTEYGTSEQSHASESGIPVLKMGDIQDGKVLLGGQKKVSDKIEDLPALYLQTMDLLYNRTNSAELVGKTGIYMGADDDYTFASYLIRIRCSKESTNPIYVNQAMNAPFFRQTQIVPYLKQQCGQANVNGTALRNMLIPLPPLAEQHRIVAKVDELMALCDRLEAASAERENQRNRLVASTHASLVAPEGSDAQPATFFINHLTQLTTRREHIQQLRQTILNLAVRGKLVPQDPKDEPASDLLERIKKENRRLQLEKCIRPAPLAPANHSLEAEADVPEIWVRCYLQELAYQITDGTHLTPKYTTEGKPFLSAQNVKPFKFMPEKHRFVSVSDFENYRANRKPERGDVLLTRVGAGIGEAAVLNSDLQFAFYVSLCLIKIPTSLVASAYLVLWLNSPEGRASSANRTYGKGASQGNLNLGLIRTFQVPLPPIAEQHRIVAKVDELMALCDRLEEQLTLSQTESHRLLESILHKSLA